MKSNEKRVSKKGQRFIKKGISIFGEKNSNLGQKFHRRSSQLEINPKSIKISNT